MKTKRLTENRKKYCSRLYKKERKKYHGKLDLKMITDNKRFWRTMKPFLTDKGVNSDKIILIENDEILSADVDIAETLNAFFSDSPKNLGIVENSYILNHPSWATDRIDIAINKFKAHRSILVINEKITKSECSFNEVALSEVEVEIQSLNSNKACTFNGIPAKSLK